MHLSDAELVAHALAYWANHIETGSMVLSANDVRERNQCLRAREQKALPHLGVDRIQLVGRLRELSGQHLGRSSLQGCKAEEAARTRNSF